MAWFHRLVPAVLAVAITGTYGQSGLTAEQKQQFVDAHNELRSSVVPPATDMKIMTWNDELATIAQNYAKQCIWGHNPNRKSGTTFSSVGENIYGSTGTVSNYRTAVQSWYDEVANYHYSSNSCDPGKVCGHYTQVVWAKSNSLGCGVERCAKLQNSLLQNALLVVCDYGPGGNFKGQQPYASARYVALTTSLEPEMVDFIDE